MPESGRGGGGVLSRPLPRSGDFREPCDGLPELLTANNSGELAIAEKSYGRENYEETYGWTREDEQHYRRVIGDYDEEELGHVDPNDPCDIDELSSYWRKEDEEPPSTYKWGRRLGRRGE